MKMYIIQYTLYNLEKCSLNFCIDEPVEFNSVLELGYAVVNLVKHS